MAHHGGRPTPALSPLGRVYTVGPSNALPRVHRPLPVPHATPSPPPRPAPPTPPRPSPPGQPHAPGGLLGGLGPPTTVPVPAEVAEVSLATPRPDGERLANEYVETPGVGVRASAGAAPCRKTVTPTPASPASPATPRHRTREPLRQSVNLPVRQQPTTFKKEPPAPCSLVLGQGLGLHAGLHAAAPVPALRGSSILCAECGRCRCAACREPRPLPSRWLCDDACFCSAETAVDYATCLCCVKGLFYHCGNAGDEGGVWCADEPCSCAGGAGSRRCARWTCLALASVALPCLWCYWPLRGLVRATELCYARYCDDGCRCERRPARPSPGPRTPPANNALLTTPEKRLLEAD